MQLSAAFLTLALLAAPAGAANFGFALRAQSTYARNWLRLHEPAPQQDELDELKGQNPEAYAIVKALLMKRSLGLLDPKHPSASFAAPPPSQEAAPSGPNVFAAFATPAPSASAAQPVAPSAGSSEVYPEVATAPKHHDWLNWKPADSAASDDAMVKNVLGEVASLAAGKKVAPAQPVADSPSTDVPVATVSADSQSSSSSAASSGWGDVFKSMQGAQKGLGEKPIAVPTEAPQAQAQPAYQAQPAATGGSDSLQGFDLKNDLVAPGQPVDDQQSSLASFSWGEDAPKADAATPPASTQQQAQPQHQMRTEAPVEATPAAAVDAAPAAPAAQPTQAPAPKKEKKNMLLAWLGGGGAALRPQGQEQQAAPQNQDQPQQAKPAKESNPYLDMMQ